MINFHSKSLEQAKVELENQFPLPCDFATANDEVAVDIINNIRNGNDSFLELSVTNLNYAYHLASLCTETEFSKLQKVFSHRITSDMFEIGWIYCQIHTDQRRAVALFSDACQFIKKHHHEVWDNSLIGRTGLSWDDIYIHSIEIMQIEKLSMDDFCDKFGILPDTPFMEKLQLTYLSKCEKETLIKNEQLLAKLIPSSDKDFLRPAIKNYTAKIGYEDIGSIINDAISYRLSNEDSNETLGLSPNVLQKIRMKRYFTILENCVNVYSNKLKVYTMVSDKINNVEILSEAFFKIDFGKYIVIDNTEWENHAFAYLPQVFTAMMEKWKSENYLENYWASMNESEISTARDAILGLKKTNIIKLEFSEFDMLYAKDILSKTRY